MVDSKGGLSPGPTEQGEQPTLRVMRLYKPRLDARRIIPSCSFSKDKETFAHASARGEGDFALSSALKLPDSFGNIYLGETFTAYISVLNHLPTTMLLNTSLSAKLQSPGNRIDLKDRRMARGAGAPRPNPAPCLNPSENLDMIVEQTLEELGMHTLRVTVQFELPGAPEGSETRSMRKFYRFSVMNPVEMSSFCTSIRGSPLVEFQLRNATQMDLLLDSCEFLPEKGVAASMLGAGVRAFRENTNNRTTSRSQSATRRSAAGKQGEGFHFAALGTAEASGHHPRNGTCWWKAGGGEGGGIEGNLSPVDRTTAVERFDGRVLLCPQESHQLMYAIRASGGAGVGRGSAESVSREGGFEEGTHTLGQVELRWRTTMGESGIVRSSPVIFEAPDRPEVEVTVDGLPDVLKLGRVAECVATVHNRSGRPMTLQLQFRTDGMVGVYVHGQSFRNLGELAPGTSVRCPLQLLALVAGLHELRGCTVADMHTAQEFPQGKLRDLLVEFPEEEDKEEVVVKGEAQEER